MAANEREWGIPLTQVTDSSGSVGQTIVVCGLSLWAFGPWNFMKMSKVYSPNVRL